MLGLICYISRRGKSAEGVHKVKLLVVYFPLTWVWQAIVVVVFVVVVDVLVVVAAVAFAVAVDIVAETGATNFSNGHGGNTVSCRKGPRKETGRQDRHRAKLPRMGGRHEGGVVFFFGTPLAILVFLCIKMCIAIGVSVRGAKPEAPKMLKLLIFI